jgi:hypothetical protein
MQPIHQFSVCVAADTLAEAEQVLAERLGHDEDYGFPYEITSFVVWPEVTK